MTASYNAFQKALGPALAAWDALRVQDVASLNAKLTARKLPALK